MSITTVCVRLRFALWRQTYLSSLDMSQSLQLLGISPKSRETALRDYDDDLIERQQAIYDDEASLIESRSRRWLNLRVSSMKI